jgi:hypothetical protein
MSLSGENVRVSAPTLSRTPDSPTALRPTRPGWRDPRLAIGVGLVAVCALLGARLLGSADDTVAVWSVRSDLVSGQAVGTTDLVATRIHFDTGSDADRYLAADDPLPADSVLTRDVGAGELLPRAALGKAADSDMVELPITVPSQAVPATLKVGSVVDIWVTVKDADASVPVLEGVSVLALPIAGGTLSPSVDRQVIVGVGTEQQAGLPKSLARLAAGAIVITGRSGR